MAHLYYLTEAVDLTVGTTVYLQGAEAHHAATVARLAVGEEFLVGDGRGTRATARALTVAPADVSCIVVESSFHDPASPEIWIVQALAKGDRDEMAIQACTELGVDRVIPWHARRSVSVWHGAKREKGVERWHKIVREASKQSLRARVPLVEKLMTTEEVAGLGSSHQLVLLDPGASDRLAAYLPPRNKAVVVIIGPEGGVDPREKELFLGSGACELKLGDQVLRTSSAGPAAVAVLNSAMGRW